MKRLQIRKWTSVLFLVLLSLTLGLVFLSGGLVLADGPFEGPPTQILEKLDPLLPHDEALSPQNIGTAATGIFYPSDDAPVQQGAPNSTDPNNFYLGAGYYNSSSLWANGLVRSYIRFDLSSLPANSIISSATLRLYQAGGADFPGQNRTVTLYRVTGSWNEATITWNNKPVFAEAIGSVTTTYDFSGWLMIDLTNLVSDWVDGSTNNYGLVAIGPESIQGVYRAFASGETANSPELQVNYLPPAPPVLDASPGIFSFQTASSEPPFNPSIQISNVTGNSLDWTATKVGSASWLTLNSPSGTGVTPTNPANLSLTINPAGLTLGSYTEQILINSNTSSVENSPLTTTVNLEVFSQLSTIYLPTIVKSGAGGSSTPRVVALIIGIDDYEVLGPAPAPISGNLPEEWGYDLNDSGYDADDAVDVITSEFGGAPGNMVIIQLGDTHKTDTIKSNSVIPATRANIVAAFGTVDQLENEDTLVIIYYSGHGGQNPDQTTGGDETDGFDEFIAASDTDVDSSGFVNILTDDDLQVLLANLESKHILIIIDSCFSGGLTGAAIATTEMGDLRPRGLVSPFASSSISAQAGISEIAGPGRLVITGGTGDQLTWESDSLQNGVFTYHFLQAWQDALHDTNQNGYISAEEAYWFSRDAADEFIFTAQSVHQNPAINDQYFGQVELR